ncbi:hypothetical protein KXQ82_13660 [Mucilaginibacter sp. HMF5004]|uniref:hypothetical protein n=1 Tax=Mucilaginibacter rivuli TaxID=2857527 RepID=UPI001C6019C2|nr:hypothetical protein [Mucilaginibacter rivuli]MBW4890772.1 hypothetical protein [Mucilaginibacter rivuli]
MHTIAKRLLFCLLIFCAFKTWAQTTTSIPLFFEKVYLHTDRDVYLQGEDIWFKAYVVNAKDHKLLDVSNNLYVELIDTKNQITDRKLIRIDSGMGKGDFKLREPMIAGTYRIRAYTNWMRNFSDYFVFEKKITILAPATNNVPVLASTGKTIPPLSTQNPISFNSMLPTVRFFPEGGPLVNNVSSQVAVKAEDAYGKGIVATGEVFASSGRSVAKFTCDSVGMGIFTLTPDETQTYRAKVTVNGQTRDIALPVAIRSGFVLSVNQADSTIVATVSCPRGDVFHYAGQNLIIKARHAGSVYYQERIPVNSNEIIITIPGGHFAEGVAVVSVYNDHNIPLCERLVYYHRKDNMVPFGISTDKATYSPKQQVTVNIKTVAKANLSMAVVDAGIVPVQDEDIQSYLLLRSEIRGDIEQAGRYFDTTNANRIKQLDMLLLTQGWREYTWRRLADSVLKITYQPERGITITGKVKEVWSEKPAPNLNITLFANKATGAKLFSARTDEKGLFSIDGVNMYGHQYFSVNAANDRGKRSAWIGVDTATINRYPVKKLVVFPDTSGTFARYRDEMENRQKVSRKFSFADTQRLRTVEIIGLRVGKKYGDTSIQVSKADYKYETLGGYYARKLQPYMQKQIAEGGLKGAPIGMVVTSDSLASWNYWRVKFFAMPMDKINSAHARLIRIDQMPTFEEQAKGFRMAPEGKDGLVVSTHFIWIDIKVKPHAFDEFDFHVTNLDMDGYYNARAFYEPKYLQASTKPDMRTTIHWEPNITTNAGGEATVSYYNADPKSKIRVIVQGVTDKGVPVAATAGYVVK